jgi:hypothetical protein
MNRHDLLRPQPDLAPTENQPTDSCEDGCFFCTGPETD